jgi:hypothetical protein
MGLKLVAIFFVSSDNKQIHRSNIFIFGLVIYRD